MLGWVSWLNVTANDGTEMWSIASATETAGQCQEGAAGAVNDLVFGTVRDDDQSRRYQQLRDSGHVFRRISPYSFSITSPNGTTREARLVCLPDTVDPRGPKAKRTHDHEFLPFSREDLLHQVESTVPPTLHGGDDPRTP